MAIELVNLLGSVSAAADHGRRATTNAGGREQVRDALPRFAQLLRLRVNVRRRG